MSKRISSFCAIVLSMALLLAFTLPSVSNVFATENGDFIVENEKYISVLDALGNAIIKEGTDYVVDTKIAESYDLNDTEINNLKEFVEISSNQEIKQILKEVPQAKEEAEKEQSAYINVAKAANNPVKSALYGVFVVFCGAALAGEFISDMYAYGAYKACHKLGKKHKSIKKACKVTGHW
ncbi:hypothetical protein P8841_06035 [Bacillus spizizenii]|uniref:hypothetical protein n=1 Tax=Bacillus spizizenii TaxID=96241 RepID=UPI00227F01D7|nr:hypothetical protein [Bacillus spizizenii]MCY7920967.1 hypothetical protein [Bacillus spizizenii]MCY8759504.1 hypothetical protein [Bacillus spizizenii]MEC0565343.1 hypothetical protein [Bacillus spizizenii]MEC1568676.1 hypothetical protein [Bacillus spizizenii]